VDSQAQPLPGFTKAPVTGDFLHRQLIWQAGETLRPSAGTVRLKISGTGDWQLYALYVGEPQILTSAQ
jgi:hypothetical protein